MQFIIVHISSSVISKNVNILKGNIIIDYLHVCISVYVCLYLHVSVYVHVFCACLCLCVCIHDCVCKAMCLCMSMHVYDCAWL